MAWTFVCPTEIIAFSERAADFAARGARVVFASTDSEYSLLAWTSASRKDGGLGKIDIPLLSDKNHSISKDYGVLIEEEGIALRGLFLIDPAGTVRQVCFPVLHTHEMKHALTRSCPDHYQRPPRRPQRRRDPASDRRFPVHRQVRRGVPRQLEPWRRDDQGHTRRQQGVSGQGACRH
jgi:peroxiredoxin